MTLRPRRAWRLSWLSSQKSRFLPQKHAGRQHVRIMQRQCPNEMALHSSCQWSLEICPRQKCGAYFASLACSLCFCRAIIIKAQWRCENVRLMPGSMIFLDRGWLISNPGSSMQNHHQNNHPCQARCLLHSCMAHKTDIGFPRRLEMLKHDNIVKTTTIHSGFRIQF